MSQYVGRRGGVCGQESRAQACRCLQRAGRAPQPPSGLARSCGRRGARWRGRQGGARRRSSRGAAPTRGRQPLTLDPPPRPSAYGKLAPTRTRGGPRRASTRCCARPAGRCSCRRRPQEGTGAPRRPASEPREQHRGRRWARGSAAVSLRRRGRGVPVQPTCAGRPWRTCATRPPSRQRGPGEARLRTRHGTCQGTRQGRARGRVMGRGHGAVPWAGVIMRWVGVVSSAEGRLAARRRALR